ncbi:DUF3046 domain-containing protein [uncultured Microbacterium sp.]|uniref:DUF3046 domain-containing protein n=1 Tax=uncultured Microbacterium sp. TaxID=191216 RepID=UPI00262A3920|nr:DUF3046 domain-containing protein [uncultured Microbacterium sp.]
MRVSEFGRAVDDEFGARGDSLVADLALAPLEYRTAAEALRDGVPPREVWIALCAATDVPLSRRHGVGLLDANKNTR